MGGIPVAVAIVVGLVSSFIQSFGLTIQRKSHVQEDLLPLEIRRRPIRRPLWLLGFTIYITSNIFSTVFQLDALPIVILAPLGAVSLIFNALLARIMLGDVFGKSSVIGTGLVTVGAVLIAVFGVVQEAEHSLDDLLELWKRPSFLAFFSIVAAATVIVLITAHFASWHLHRQMFPAKVVLSGGSDTPPELESPAPSNYASPHDPAPIPFRPTLKANRRWSSPVSPLSTTDQLVPDLSIDPKATPPPISADRRPHHVRFVPSYLDDRRRPAKPLNIDIPPPPDFGSPDAAQQRSLTLIGLAFASASGTLSGMSLVLAKAAVELLVITIDHYRTGKGENQFNRAQSWLLVVGLGLGAILQLVYLNYSLTFASPALICPLAFCFFNLSSIFDGLVFYDQFGRLKPYQIALVSIGVVILLLGVWVVSLIRPPGEGHVEVGTWVEDESDDELEVEETSTLFGGHTHQDPEPMSPVSEESPMITPTKPHFPTSSSNSSPTSPSSSRGVYSPTSPLSPGARRRHRPIYGTLIPEYSHPGAPTGFSIGLGAASPGFVFRSSSLSGHHRRARTQSESQAGILALIHDAEAQAGLNNQAEGSDAAGNEQREGNGADEADGQNHGRRQSWWRSMLSRKDEGEIRLP